MAARSPRDGWRIVELRDGRWWRTATGDREIMRDEFQKRTRAIYDLPTPPGGRFSMRTAGHAVVLFDAVGQRRDECPSLPRSADGTRIEWPSEVPGVDGADAVVWVAKGSVAS